VIYLQPEVASAYGEDTFWTWAKREFPKSTFAEPVSLNDEDIIFQYSVLGAPKVPGKSLALCWEMYPLMKEALGGNDLDEKIARCFDAAKNCTYRAVGSWVTEHWYEQYGPVMKIPVGVDTDLFKPLYNKFNLRKKYNLPLYETIGIWLGTSHPMKGYRYLAEYAAAHPYVHWITVTYSSPIFMPGATRFQSIDQVTYNELLNAADFYLSTSQLQPFFMCEWEALAADTKMIIAGVEPKEFVPGNRPRKQVFDIGWDRHSLKKTLVDFLDGIGVEWQ